jgi:exosome complex component RRP41
MAKTETKKETKESSSYTKRADGRKMDEMRPIEAKAGVIPRADGSAYFKQGDTIAYAAVYGPRDLYPKFLQNPKSGILRCNYNMMPFSGSGNRVRPGGSRRSKEISMITEKALLPVLDLSEFPNAVIDVFIELPQTDAGSRCAGICAAAIALADAGIPMKDMVAAVSMGFYEGKILTDINGYEDMDMGATDIPIAMLSRTGEISLLQMDGEISKAELVKVLDTVKGPLKRINEIQRAALKKKYEGA